MLFDIILCFYINLDFNRETKADKWLFNFYLPFFMSFIKNPLDAKDSNSKVTFTAYFVPPPSLPSIRQYVRYNCWLTEHIRSSEQFTFKDLARLVAVLQVVHSNWF